VEEFAPRAHPYSQKQVQTTGRDKSLAAHAYTSLEYYYGHGAIRKCFVRNAEFQTRGYNKK
jgi:hypothetical protein